MNLLTLNPNSNLSVNPNKDEIDSIKPPLTIKLRRKSSVSITSPSKYSTNSYRKANRISFIDRNMIRKLQFKTNKLDSNDNDKYLNQYLDDKELSNKTLITPKDKSQELLNYLKEIKEHENENSLNKKKRKKKYTSNVKYRLRDLMVLNPYHYVPKSVMFSTSINRNLISRKLNTGKNISNYNNEKTNNINYSLPSKKINYKNSKNRKVFESSSILFFDKNFKRDELIWRLISKINPSKGVSSFKQAVKYEAISKVWKVHSLIIEKLLVNYTKFKWFLEREKYINENVFLELISLLKLNKNGGIDFTNKIFLIFDEGNGNIKVKDVFFFMNITSDLNSPIDKINFIVNLFENYNRIGREKSVNIEEIYEYFKCIIGYENYRRDYKKLIDHVKNEFLFGRNITENAEENYFEKKRIHEFLSHNDFIQLIIKKFYRNYSIAHKLYNEELINVFNGTMRNYKRMLNIHDIIEYCHKDIENLEQELYSIEQKSIIQNQLKDFINYLNEESDED